MKTISRAQMKKMKKRTLEWLGYERVVIYGNGYHRAVPPGSVRQRGIKGIEDDIGTIMRLIHDKTERSVCVSIEVNDHGDGFQQSVFFARISFGDESEYRDRYAQAHNPEAAVWNLAMLLAHVDEHENEISRIKSLFNENGLDTN